MDGMPFKRGSPCLWVLGLLGLTVLFAGCGQREVPPRRSHKPSIAVSPFDAGTAKEHQRMWAEQLGVPVEITNSIGMKLVLIPPGEFVTGSAQSPEEVCASANLNPEIFVDLMLKDEHPQHRVQITKPFYLGAHEVTQEQYRHVMGTQRSQFAAGGKFRDRIVDLDTRPFPVENVTALEAGAFCRKLSLLRKERSAGRLYLLPTEAEWEYACRAGTTTPFHFGSQLSGREANCNGGDPYGTGTKGTHLGRTNRCGSYAANAFGLYDMHGNVSEWCQDWYAEDYYRKSPMTDPPGPSSATTALVIRGGSWADIAGNCRSASRAGSPPALRSEFIGFRVIAILSGKSSRAHLRAAHRNPTGK
jgi:formylglycine-generating enzyme required for sulfatase activity